MFITPHILARLLGEREYVSVVSRMYPSVPEKTRRNILKGKSKPRKKTLEKIVQDLAGQTGLSEEILFDLMQESHQPWKTGFSLPECTVEESLPESLRYAIEVIVQFESAFYDAGDAGSAGDVDWASILGKTGVPSEILPPGFFQDCLEGYERKVYPPMAGKVVLRTSLFCLAACEVALMFSSEEYERIGLWVHRGIPRYEGQRLIGPMRHFFDKIIEASKLESVAGLARALSSLKNNDLDVEDQRRELARWRRGEEPPSWNTMRWIRDELFDGQPNFLITYGVIRFLQSWFNDFKKHGIPQFFEDEAEIVSVFGEYPKWQEYHLERFSEWKEARG